MSVVDEARCMRDRMPWNVGQKILSSLELPRGKGWDNTVQKFASQNDRFDQFREPLRQYLVQHFACGEKMLRLHLVEPAIGQMLSNTLSASAIPESAFRDRYPALVPTDQLAGLPTVPTLVNVNVDDSGVTATFASVRVLSIREELDRTELPAEAADALSGFDELVGIRHERWQAMDVVRVSPDGTQIDVRIDFPLGMPSNAGDFAHLRIRQELARLAGRDLLPLPTNLFPLIDRIYKAEGEGNVVELAFGTTTASLKHEKMRRRKTCLRQEAYHQGGKQALASEIEIHRISVLWALPWERTVSRPELTLNATLHSAAAAAPVLTNAIIRNCADESDFEHVRGRMLHYLALEE